MPKADIISGNNKTGLKNLFKIISLANTTYLYKSPRILRSKLEELREGLLIGSGCANGDIFVTAYEKSYEEYNSAKESIGYNEEFVINLTESIFSLVPPKVINIFLPF